MSVPSSVDDWTDEYESILEFYFWEPQHLNRQARRAPKSGRNPGVDIVLDRLRTKEVPLNHLLGLFFRLVPTTLAARVLASMSRTAVGDTAKHVNTAEFRRSEIYGICQPDFLFRTGDGLAFLEVKVGSKTSLDQIARYAALAAKWGVAGPVRLILLGKDARFAEADGFGRLATGELKVSAKVANRFRQSGLTDQDVAAQLSRMQLHRTSFRELHGALSREMELLDRSREGEQTLHSLISGIANALIRLRLVGPDGAQPA